MTFPQVDPEPRLTGQPAIDPSAAVSDEDRLEGLVVQLHEAPSVQQTIDRFLAFAVAFLDCDHATIALKRRTGLWPAAATDDVSYAALVAQIDLGQGPCVTAASTGLSVLVPDTSQEIRWPEWTREVTPRGRSIFSIPLTADGSTLGALNLTSERPHIFDATDIRAPRVATYGATAIAAAQEHECLVEAVEAGKRVGQAIGILRERFSLDDARAFDVLKRHSQHGNIRLRDVAEHLLETGQLPGPVRHPR